MAVVALLCIILGVIFSFYLFGLTTFNRGTAQIDLQQNVRLAASYIIQELRFASSLEVLACGLEGDSGGEIEYTKPDDPANKKYRIKRNAKNEIFLYTITDSSCTANIIAYDISALFFELGDDHLLSFEITGVNGEQVFSVKSRVRPRNL